MSQEDFNGILDVAMSMACDTLEEKGFFYPIAVTLEKDGSFQRSGELSEEDEKKDPEELLKQIHTTLESGCRQQLHIAVAVGTDVKVQHPQEGSYVKAIEVSIEHQSGLAHDCYLPYQKSADGKIQYGNIFSTSVEPSKFNSAE
ncbi:MAG: hypothetical protein HRT88_13085 [Lentisphaeraceae bacterium]|nr:hypothetical protein [Lentisphaeraceae bacterium]